MAQCTTRWFLSLQITLYLFLIFVQGNEDADDAYRNSKSLVLEYFLPINFPAGVKEPLRREKRDVEGSGEDESAFSELKEKGDADKVTPNAFGSLLLGKEGVNNSTTLEEGSGEIASESSEGYSGVVPLIDDSEIWTTTQDSVAENQTQEILTSTEMIFDKSEDFDAIKTEVPTKAVITTIQNREFDAATEGIQFNEDNTTVKLSTTTVEASTIWTTESATIPVLVNNNIPNENPPETTAETVSHIVKTTALSVVDETTTAVPTVVAQEVPGKAVIDAITTPQWITSPKTTKDFSEIASTPEPVLEELFKETRIVEKVEALPGKILQKENLSLGADLLLIANTRLMDSEETVQQSSTEPKRLGAYIVIGLILLSFSSLVGYITFRKRMNRRKHEFERKQESNDTEKALLSLSEYKDNLELEDNQLKNNEITPIVVKSNSQINKFEKNTNFSSPKNLNTIANEKNIEKDNVLKSTAENLTQVIIEDSPKDVEENVPSMEKLIVKTRIDQDSIPKKPIIINKSSTGYMPIPQDNS